MGAMPDRLHGATCRSLILWLLWSAMHVGSERPQGQNPDGEHRQLEGSLVEVGAHHLLLAKAPKETLQESQHLQRGDTVEVLETFEGNNEEGTKQTLRKGIVGTVPMAAIQVSPPDDEDSEDDMDDFESELSAGHTTPQRRTFNLDGDVEPLPFQVPGHDAQHRQGGLDPDTFSTGDSRLDRLGETDTPDIFGPSAPTRPKPLIDLDAGQEAAEGANAPNALFVPDEPEKSHVEADMAGDNEAMERYNHFQELLALKPAVDKAIGYFRRDVGKVRKNANGLVRKTLTAVKRVEKLNGGVKSVEDAEAGASKESEKETRKLAVDSVENFDMYNKHGVFGKDSRGRKAEWSRDAGKWNIFKLLTNQAKDLSMDRLKHKNFQAFLNADPHEHAVQTQHNLQEDEEATAEPVTEEAETEEPEPAEKEDDQPVMTLPDSGIPLYLGNEKEADALSDEKEADALSDEKAPAQSGHGPTWAQGPLIALPDSANHALALGDKKPM